MKLTAEQHEELSEVLQNDDLLEQVTEFIEGLTALKVRTIKLKKDPSEQGYHVDELTDSVQYSPGQFLEKDEVEKLCVDKAWKVKVVRLK